MMSKRGSRLAGWLLVAVVAVVAIVALVLTISSSRLRVVDAAPADGAAGVPITTPVYLTFSQPMDAASVEARLRLEPETPGHWQWQDRTISFQPQSALSPDTGYTLTLQPGAASRRGHTLDKALTWQFRTRNPQLLYLGRPAPGAEIRQLFSASLDGAPPRALTGHPGGVWDYTVDPQGDAIVYSVLREDGGSDLWRMERDGSGQRLLLSCPDAACLNPAWSPDGTQLAYERRDIWAAAPNLDPKAGHLWLLDLEENEERPLVDVAAHSPVWGPDAGRLAYVVPLIPGVEVYDLGADDLQQFGNEWGAAPVWSPDGHWLVMPELMLAGEDLVVRLVRVDLYSEELADISGDDDFVKDVSPAWSPAGGWIAFGRQYLDDERWTPGRQIWLTRPDASEAYSLLEEPMADHFAFAWRQDGAVLAYALADLSQEQALVPDVSVWVFDLVGREPRQIARDAVLPGWLP